MSRSTAANPLVSVILPTRNRASTLVAAVDSVLRGTYGNIELLVVDDASVDDTLEVLRAVDDPRLKVTALGAPVGAAQARNVAADRARGQFLAFQDSDDRWAADHLDVLIGAFENGSAAVAYGNALDEAGVLTPGPGDSIRDGDLRQVLPRRNVIPLPASVIRTEVFESVGGFEPSLPRFQDWELFLKISRDHEFAYVDHLVLEVGLGPGRISKDQDSYYVALSQILDRHSDLFCDVAEHEVAYRMQLLRHELLRKRPAAAARHGRAVSAHPGLVAKWAFQRIIKRQSPLTRGFDV